MSGRGLNAAKATRTARPRDSDRGDGSRGTRVGGRDAAALIDRLDSEYRASVFTCQSSEQKNSPSGNLSFRRGIDQLSESCPVT
jgi:hypothetical protein